MQNQTTFELYTDDNKWKYPSNPKDFLKSTKKFCEKLYTKQTHTAATIEFLSKITNRTKIFNEHFNLCKAKIFSEEIVKSINSETNNKSLGNNGLTADFYKYFPNELTPVLIDVHESWGKLGTIVVISRTRIRMIFYIKMVIK